MITLEEFVVRVADRDPHLTRRVLLDLMQRHGSCLQRALDDLLPRPGSRNSVHIRVARQRMEIIRQLLDALEQQAAGVPLDQIRVPEEALGLIPTLNLAGSSVTDREGELTPLETLGLPVKVQNTLIRGLRRMGITPSVEELVELYNKRGEEGLLSLRSFGAESLRQTLDALREGGYIE